MRKAQKRELGRIKQEKNREESRQSGLLAQGQDQKSREDKHRDKLLRQDASEVARKLRENGKYGKTTLDPEMRRSELMEALKSPDVTFTDARSKHPDSKRTEYELIEAANETQNKALDDYLDSISVQDKFLR